MPEKKSHHAYIIITVLAIAGIFLLLKYKKTPVPVSTTDNTPVVVDGWQSEEVKKKEISEKVDGYNISVFYPETNNATVTKYMQDFAENSVAQFKNDTAWINDPALPKSESSIAALLQIDYTTTKTDAVQTYIFSVASDTGGAHGNTGTVTFSFLKDGQYIPIEKLFTDETKGLAAVSAYTITEIKRRAISADDWIADGAAPKPENYKSFSVTQEGVTFYFDPYQVASYAAGPQAVSVPFGVLRAYLNPSVLSQ